jgi:hypothetical protein
MNKRFHSVKWLMMLQRFISVKSLFYSKKNSKICILSYNELNFINKMDTVTEMSQLPIDWIPIYDRSDGDLWHDTKYPLVLVGHVTYLSHLISGTCLEDRVAYLTLLIVVK